DRRGGVRHVGDHARPEDARSDCTAALRGAGRGDLSGAAPGQAVKRESTGRVPRAESVRTALNANLGGRHVRAHAREAWEDSHTTAPHAPVGGTGGPDRGARGAYDSPSRTSGDTTQRSRAVMPTGATLLTFAAATLAILVIPGPSVVYVMTRSIEQGRRAGLYSMLGLETGALLHVLATAVGLAALLASSELAFTIIRYGGAGYLLYLGARQLRTRARGLDLASGLTSASRRRLYRD